MSDMTVELAIFDFDGTLADTFPLFLDCYASIASRRGLRALDGQALQQLRSLPTREILKAIGLPLWKVPSVAMEFRQAMHDRRQQVRPFPGVAQVLGQLRQGGMQLALVTSNSRALVEHVFGAELSGMFAGMECDVGLFAKSRRLRQLLRTLGVQPLRTIYLGDETRDGDAARQAGIAFGAVAWGYTAIDTLLQVPGAQAFDSVPALQRLLAPEP